MLPLDATFDATHSDATHCFHRWNSQDGKGNDSTIMNRHYLRNLSTEVVLANAGFRATSWKSYYLPRARGGTIHDAHVKRLIEFFYPDLYEKCERAQRAYNGNPDAYNSMQCDAISETNLKFLENLRQITFFWLQDAVILLDKDARYGSVRPWSLLYYSQNSDDFTALGNQILAAQVASNAARHTEMLSQTELLENVHNGAIQAVHHLESRLSQHPNHVAAVVEALNVIRDASQVEAVRKGIEETFTKVMRRMAVGILADETTGSTSASDATRTEAGATQGDAQGSQNDATRTEAGATQGAAQNMPDGFAQWARADDDEFINIVDPLAGAANLPPPAEDATQADATQADATQANATQANATQAGSWLPPRVIPNVQGSTGPKRRKQLPAPDSSRTGPRRDGFYAGNDLHTVLEVWQMHQDLLEWLRDSPQRRHLDSDAMYEDATPHDWGCKGGASEEKEGQARLRGRRKAIWDAVKCCAVQMSVSHDAVVVILNDIQQELKAGISRVENWAVEAKKDKWKASEKGILSVAEAYRATKYEQQRTTSEQRM